MKKLFFLFIMNTSFCILSQSLPVVPDNNAHHNELLATLSHNIEEQDLESVKKTSRALLTYIKSAQEQGNDYSDLTTQLHNKKRVAQKQKEDLETQVTSVKWLLRILGGTIVAYGIVSTNSEIGAIATIPVGASFYLPREQISKAEQIVQCTDILLNQAYDTAAMPDSPSCTHARTIPCTRSYHETTLATLSQAIQLLKKSISEKNKPYVEEACSFLSQYAATIANNDRLLKELETITQSNYFDFSELYDIAKDEITYGTIGSLGATIVAVLSLNPSNTPAITTCSMFMGFLIYKAIHSPTQQREQEKQDILVLCQRLQAQILLHKKQDPEKGLI